MHKHKEFNKSRIKNILQDGWAELFKEVNVTKEKMMLGALFQNFEKGKRHNQMQYVTFLDPG